MTSSTRNVTVRAAARSDCAELAQLINLAGESLPLYLWQQMAGADGDPWEIGRQRAARDSGSFSYRNSVVAEVDGEIAGALVGYPVADEPEAIDTDSTPAMWIPLLKLESCAAGTWYVNSVATFPEFRELGVGSKLMRWAEQHVLDLGLRGVSLIVSDANQGARRLYERLGYAATASRPMVKEQWQNDGKTWVLMIKTAAP